MTTTTTSTSTTTWREALMAEAARRPELIVMTAENRAAIRDLPSALGSRFIDVGIAEQTLVGMAAGLALRGRRPVAHALAAFLTMRAFEFIRTDVGIARLPVTLVGSFAGLSSEANGPTHQAIEDVSLMRGIPGMTVFCPADRDELVDGLGALLDRDGPCYVRYNAGEPIARRREPVAIGRAEILHEGRHLTLLGYGVLLGELVRARELLAKRGISAGLINVRTLAPIDRAAIVAASRATPVLVTVEDHFVTGGLASIVAELLCKDGPSRRLVSIGFDGRWFRPGLMKDLLERERLSAAAIAERVEQSL